MYTYMLTYMSIHDAYMYIYFTYMSHICAFRMGGVGSGAQKRVKSPKRCKIGPRLITD